MRKINTDLEWESINFPLKLSNIVSENRYYKVPEDATIEIDRGNTYELKAKLYGRTNNLFSISEIFEYKSGEKVLPGSFKEYENFQAVGIDDGKNYLLKGCHLNSYSSSGDGNYSGPVYVKELIENCHSEPLAKKVVDWFLCSELHVWFPRATRRTSSKKARLPFDEERNINSIFNNETAYSTSSDYYLIHTDELKFVAQKISRKEEYMPSWSGGLAIEYREIWGGTPDQSSREAIKEIVGFLFGTELFRVGTTEYDSKDRVVRRIASATKEVTIARCKSKATPPFRFKSVNSIEDESTLSELVTSYLDQRKALNFGVVLWKYWIAKFLPIGTNLPILSSALENLCEAYIKENKLVKRYNEEEKQTYKKLIEEELEILNEKLTPYDFKKRILDKLKNPFSTGIGEKMKIFLDKLELSFSSNSIENKALRSRNAMTHGSLPSGVENDKKYIRLSIAYRTLVNRIILKVLGYTGNYIDYYTEGQPERHISENLPKQ